MKYSGITEHNKAAFDAIVPRVNEAIKSGEINVPSVEQVNENSFNIYLLEQNKQEKLVSGTNIKTIGGQSILGSGNLAISGGTQLYKHEFSVKDGNDVKAIFTIYALSNTPICSNGDYFGFKDSSMKNCVPIAIYITETGDNPSLCITLVNHGVTDLHYYKNGSIVGLSGDFEGYTTTADTVTPL